MFVQYHGISVVAVIGATTVLGIFLVVVIVASTATGISVVAVVGATTVLAISLVAVIVASTVTGISIVAVVGATTVLAISLAAVVVATVCTGNSDGCSDGSYMYYGTGHSDGCSHSGNHRGTTMLTTAVGTARGAGDRGC